jgi:hypothetical protein
MKHRYNQICRNEADEYDTEGLESRMAKFINEQESQPVSEPEPEQSSSEPPVSSESGSQPDSDDEEFPVIGGSTESPEPKADEAAEGKLDEAEFDRETEEQLKGMDEKQGNKWKQLRQSVKEARQQALEAQERLRSAPVPEEIRQELETLRKIKEEADGLRQRNEELMRKSDDLMVRESEEFLSRVTHPSREIEQAATLLAESAELEPDAIFNIILEQDPIKQDRMIEQMEHRLGRRGASRLERLADDYKAVLSARDQLLADAPKTLATDRQRREEALREEQQRVAGEFRDNARSAFDRFSARVPGFTDSSGQLTDMAQSVRNRVVALDPGQLRPEDLGYMAFAAEALPSLRKALVQLQKENQALKAGRPQGSPMGSSPVSSRESRDEGEPHGLMEAMRGKQFTFSGT